MNLILMNMIHGICFQLSEVVNSVSPQGQLPLGIALMGRSTGIAQTLVQTGKADVNAYNAEVRQRNECSCLQRFQSLNLLQGCTLLIDAVKRGDGFSAQFLLEQDCNVNLTSKLTNDAALHIVCTYSEKSTDSETLKEMVLVGNVLLAKSADINLQNAKGL